MCQPIAGQRKGAMAPSNDDRACTSVCTQLREYIYGGGQRGGGGCSITLVLVSPAASTKYMLSGGSHSFRLQRNVAARSIP